MVAVFIYLPGTTEAVPAGHYQYDPANRSGHFSYVPEYLVLPDALPVDVVGLPLEARAKTTFLNEGLHGAFRDSVPDLWGRMVLEKFSGIPVHAMAPEQLLLMSDASRVGNLDFRESFGHGESAFGPPAVAQLDDLVEAASIVESDADLSLHMRLLLRHGSSMGGARPKCLVEDKDGLWVAKLPSKHDRWNNARVEMATMRLAACCGIRIPEMRVVQAADRDILLLKRFDRGKTPSGYIRSGYLSALSVMELDENEGHRHSYLTFADRLRSLFPRDWTRKQGEELFLRMLFNVFVRNNDDHARNHGILLHGATMEISPAFDVVPSVSKPGPGTEFYLAMAAGPRGRIADIHNVLDGAAHFGLRVEHAVIRIQEMGERIGRWKEFFEAAGVCEEDTEKFVCTFDSPQREKALQL